MNDYDALSRALPITGRQKFHFSLFDSSLCVLKLAAKYDNILSDNNKSLLKGFGQDLPLSTTSDDKPILLFHVQRREITSELFRNRTRMYNLLQSERE
jgi:hypothetical protein